MQVRQIIMTAIGGALCLAMSLAAANTRGNRFVADLERAAIDARDNAGGRSVKIAFRDRYGWITRHPILSGGASLDASARTRVATAIAAVPGVGGIRWVDSAATGTDSKKLHCQDDVDTILKTRTIRFAEASAKLDPGSERLLDEVAQALRPCLGSIIAITGHTDGNGNPASNIALSNARADAVRWALVGRGIPADGLRATGVGAARPVAGLDPLDPANRRIEFSVIVSAPVKPTPIDTPGPGR